MLRASRYRQSKYLLDWYYVYASVIRSWEHGVRYTEPVRGHNLLCSQHVSAASSEPTLVA